MGPLDTLWHLLNFLSPAVGIGLLAPLMAKLLWRRSLKRAPWVSLSLWATGGASVALVAGLVVFGRDGRVATYAMMVAGSALCMAWAGFIRPR